MPKQRVKIYESTNDFYQIVPGARAGRGGKVFGICMAVTSIWGRKFLEGTRDLLTKPQSREAEAIQVRYNMFGEKNGYDDGATREMLKFARVAGEKKFANLSCSIALRTMGFEPGIYLVMNHEHAIGFNFSDGKYYFYDCDENGAGGLFLYSDLDDCKSKVLASGYTSDEKWECWKLTSI